MKRAKVFRKRLVEGLRNARHMRLDDHCDGLTGSLRIGRQAVGVEVIYHRKLKQAILHPPLVWTTAPWMHRELDWHCYPDARLCWVKGSEWTNHLLLNKAPSRKVAYNAANWILTAVPDLIYRHRLRELEGLTSWPDHWPEYGHGQDATKDEREREAIARAKAARPR